MKEVRIIDSGQSLDIIDKTLSELNQMETASLQIQKVGLVLSGTMSHVIMSGARKTPHSKGGARILTLGKSTKVVEMC